MIKPKGDARYIRRDSKGRIKESDDVGRSLKTDRERKAKTSVRPGYGDRGDKKGHVNDHRAQRRGCDDFSRITFGSWLPGETQELPCLV